MIRRLFIVRHGDTFVPGEPPRRIGARTDPPLAPSGIGQAIALADHFRAEGVAFATALTGPSRRARGTAALVLADQQRSVPLLDACWLAEIDHGPDENHIEAVVKARIGAAAIAAWDREGIAPAGWVVDRERRSDAWRRLLADPPPGDTLLVTSNGAARFALLALNLTRRPALKLRTGAFGIVERVEGSEPGVGVWRVTAWDRRPSAR